MRSSSCGPDLYCIVFTIEGGYQWLHLCFSVQSVFPPLTHSSDRHCWLTVFPSPVGGQILPSGMTNMHVLSCKHDFVTVRPSHLHGNEP